MEHYAQENAHELDDEGIIGGYQDIPHHPIIDQVAKAMVGEQQLRPLNPIAFDSSGYNLNDRKRKRLELFQNYLSEKFIQPIMEQVSQQYMQENPGQFLNPPGDSFWDTTKNYIAHPEAIVGGVAEQVPMILAATLSSGTAGTIAKVAGASAASGGPLAGTAPPRRSAPPASRAR